MRQAFSSQLRFDCVHILNVMLHLNCRDEIIPILAALQFIYSQPELRDAIMKLIPQDVNPDSRQDGGRPGMDYWQILVLAAVRLGCNLDYDKLQDLAENHRNLRQIMGIGDWDTAGEFNWRRIRDNVCAVRVETLDQINRLVVQAGHRLFPQAVEKVRVDSFVEETNIHYPTESSLIFDGMRVIIGICVKLSIPFLLAGWRQHEHLLKKFQSIARQIERISSRKGPGYQKRLKKQYQKLLQRAEEVIGRAKALMAELSLRPLGPAELSQLESLRHFIQLTEQVCDTARRRVLQGEKVPNAEKIFSLFEPHTQLYKRGKAGEPVQFGRLVLVYEDAAGFILHWKVVPRDVNEKDVVVEQSRLVQEQNGGRIKEMSFDMGFHTPENQIELAKIVPDPCVPKPGVKQAAEQQAAASVKFHQARKRHPGIESAIGACKRGTAWNGAGIGANSDSNVTPRWGSWAVTFTCWASW
jgi:hypothetical protein